MSARKPELEPQDAASQRGALPDIVRPLERFLRTESGSASLIMAAAVVALVWANVAGESYEEFWATTVAFEVGPLHLEEDLVALVNELLMVVFFYVVALEVKREALHGSLREASSAAVPIAAAVGTMVGGAVVYVVVNVDGGDLSGWAVPIATDIAFALGVLGIAGHRAPRELRAFLLTLAIVDDIGTILVIALFFAEDISLVWLAVAGGLVLTVLGAQRLGVRQIPAYVVLAGGVWLATFESGVHPTIAGVVLGLLTPAAARYSREAVAERVRDDLAEITAPAHAEVSENTMAHVRELAREAVSPRARLEDRLHPWSAYLVLPVFALANAGVVVSVDALGAAVSGPIGVGILLGLVIGAPMGGLLLAFLLVRFGPARLPEGLDWPAIGGVAPLKGIGFTVAIFISLLAFDDPAIQQEAKLAILCGSALAGVIGLTVLHLRYSLLKRRRRN